VEDKVSLDPLLFGEGLARVGGRLYQITWQNGRMLVWNLARLEKEREVTYEGEGWGLCYDGKRLVMSDGSDRLQFRDPETFAKVGEVSVRRAGLPQRQLNELECADGLVYANVWTEPFIARIDPASGEVTGWIDASGLLTREESAGVDVLNGIARVPGSRRFLLTGKLWPRLFEVELVPAPERPTRD
jgi:glutaminyl-peptide cyclotransferase